MRTPSSLGQSLIFDNKIESTCIHPEPLFILGHWRSGTTYLHELLVQTGRYNYLSYLQALFPCDFLGQQAGWRAILKFALPKTRPMDRVQLGPDAPAEEGLALACMGPHSMYHAFTFPDKLSEIFRSAALFEGTTKESLQEWKKQYLYLLKKISFSNEKKPLVLKDPAHTAHVNLLLELFPKAKFVYIERDRDQVITSTRKMCRMLCQEFALQKYDIQKVEAFIPDMYDLVMSKYRRDRLRIDSRNLLEIQYLELIERPNAIVEKILSFI